MRLSRIFMALTIGLAVVAAPTAAGAARPYPTPSPTGSPPPTYPPKPSEPPTYPPKPPTCPTMSSTHSGKPPTCPTYPPKPWVLKVHPSTIVVGEKATLSGAEFGAHETVEITVTSTPMAAGLPGRAHGSDGGTVAMAPVANRRDTLPPLTVETDRHGRFTTTYEPKEPGRYLFTAADQREHRPASATLTVLAAPVTPTPTPTPKPPNGLPVTGDDLGTPLAVGGGLLGVGVVLTLAGLAWRRRGRFGIGSPR